MAQRHDESAEAGESVVRSGATRPIATLVPKLTRKALGKHGFSSATLISEWPVIVGDDLAAGCAPVNLAFPRGRREGGTLLVRAAGGAALELQHMAPAVIERINAYLGYRAVARLKIVHRSGPTPRRGRSEGRHAAEQETHGVPDQPEDGEIERVGDVGLRRALARLGNAIRSDRTDRTS